MEKIYLNSKWTYTKSDFNAKTSDDESLLVTFSNHFKGEEKLISKKNILKLKNFNLPIYIWMNGFLLDFQRGLKGL